MNHYMIVYFTDGTKKDVYFDSDENLKSTVEKFNRQFKAGTIAVSGCVFSSVYIKFLEITKIH